MASTKSMKLLINAFLISTLILLFAGFGTAQSSVQAAATKEYTRLLDLRKALRKIPFDKQDKEPHRSFLKRNEKDLVYSDPAGEWYVRSDRFWALQKKYRKLAIADRIAWTAAENPLPGECEGYVPCYLYSMRRTYGEYLKLYPKGTYSRKALKGMIAGLGYLVEDAASAKKNYDGPTEAADDAEFAGLIKELRDILKPVPHPDKTKVLSQLKTIEAAYK